jgi:hypothetical protein
VIDAIVRTCGKRVEILGHADIAVEKPNVRHDFAKQCGRVMHRQVVGDHHIVAALDEHTREVRSNEARAAGDENSHSLSSLGRDWKTAPALASYKLLSTRCN